MNDQLGLYKMLRVSCDASYEQIRAAYRRQALKLHPDKNRGDKNAEENFKRLVYAYGILGDPHSRSVYDQLPNISEDVVCVEENGDPSGKVLIIYGIIVLMACFFLTPFYWIGLIILLGLIIYGVMHLVKNISRIVSHIKHLTQAELICLILVVLCVLSSL